MPASQGWCMRSTNTSMKVPGTVWLETVPSEPSLSSLPSVPIRMPGIYIIKEVVSKRRVSFWGPEVKFSLRRCRVLFYRIPRSRRLNQLGSPTTILHCQHGNITSYTATHGPVKNPPLGCTVPICQWAFLKQC